MLGAFIRRHNPNDTGLKIPEYFCRHSIANNVFFFVKVVNFNSSPIFLVNSTMTPESPLLKLVICNTPD